MNSVTGTVTIDGKPVSGADVTFWPKTPNLGSYVSRTGPDGKFQMMKDPRPHMGFKPGTYAVIVTKFVSKNAPKGKEEVPLPAGGDLEGSRNTLPAKYADKDTSPLNQEIKPGDNDFKIELTSK